MGELADIHEVSRELLPIGTIDGDWLAVLAPSARRQKRGAVSVMAMAAWSTACHPVYTVEPHST